MPNWMPKGLMPRRPSTNSAADSAASRSTVVASGSTDSCYLPDFSTTTSVVSLVFISALVSVILSLASDTSVHGFFVHLANTALLMLWMVLTSAGVITLLRPVLARLSVIAATVLSIGLVLANIALLSAIVYYLGQWLGPDAGELLWTFPADLAEFLARNLAIGALVCMAVLRYFYVTHQWVSNMQSEAQARITALQARIRPHFLFNSMNTIAALTRTNPAAAEQAVEDLADLFRASLSTPGDSITLEQELEIARVYQRMEEQRLGARLQVSWEIDGLPMEARIPGLTIQPLLENAIYHGIEPLADGGEIIVSGRRSGSTLEVEIRNPVAPEQPRVSEGNKMALANIRERFELAFAGKGSVAVDERGGTFSITLRFPEQVAGA